MILITGATGHVGTELLQRLSRRGQKVRVLVRRGSGRGAIPARSVEFVEGDFNQPASFVPALTGVERLFLLIPSSEHVEQQQKELRLPRDSGQALRSSRQAEGGRHAHAI